MPHMLATNSSSSLPSRTHSRELTKPLQHPQQQQTNQPSQQPRLYNHSYSHSSGSVDVTFSNVSTSASSIPSNLLVPRRFSNRSSSTTTSVGNMSTWSSVDATPLPASASRYLATTGTSASDKPDGLARSTHTPPPLMAVHEELSTPTHHLSHDNGYESSGGHSTGSRRGGSARSLLRPRRGTPAALSREKAPLAALSSSFPSLTIVEQPTDDSSSSNTSSSTRVEQSELQPGPVPAQSTGGAAAGRRAGAATSQQGGSRGSGDSSSSSSGGGKLLRTVASWLRRAGGALKRMTPSMGERTTRVQIQ